MRLSNFRDVSFIILFVAEVILRFEEAQNASHYQELNHPLLLYTVYYWLLFLKANLLHGAAPLEAHDFLPI